MTSWSLEASGGGQAFWHCGDNPGYKCFVLALQDSRTGVVVMTNSDAGRALCAWIVQQALGADHPALGWLERHYQHDGGIPRSVGGASGIDTHA